MQAVLSDFAGTLFMPRAPSVFVSVAAERLGLRISPDCCERLAAECLIAGFPGGPYPATVPDELSEAYALRDLSSDAHRTAYCGLLSTVMMPHPGLASAIYDQIREPTSWVPYADAHGFIRGLERRGVRTGVVSNVGFDLRLVLRAHGFDELARHCTLSCEVGATKPDPKIFEAALRDIGSAASHALMVGDHEHDDRGAERLGIRTVILPMTPPGSHHGLSKVLDALG